MNDCSSDDSDNGFSNSSLVGIDEEPIGNFILKWLSIYVVDGSAINKIERVVTNIEGVVGNCGEVCHGERSCS